MPIDTSRMITGQLMTRTKGTDAQGRTVMIVCGVIAVPANLALPDESLLTVTSDELVGMVTDKPHLVLHTETAQSLADDPHNADNPVAGFTRLTPHGWLTEHKWRM